MLPQRVLLGQRLFAQALKTSPNIASKCTLTTTPTILLDKRPPLKAHIPETVDHIATPEDAFKLVSDDLCAMFTEIHAEIDADIRSEKCADMAQMAKYYFDGQGKAVRPVLAMTVSHAFNHHLGHANSDVVAQQRKVALISEMIHTASLVHDDVLDHAETRRGKVAVNQKWGCSKSALCGDYILAVGSRVLAQIRNEEVLRVLSQVLEDLVTGEFQQLQNKNTESERFQLYLQKTFNKTASLIAYSCKANAILSATSVAFASPSDLAESAFQFGRNVGIAFQLVDDLLDFEASSAQLGKPAAADLKLGLATAPVLFASKEFPELETLIARRFSEPGDVESAFDAVGRSSGLERTRELAANHCQEALKAIHDIKESKYKAALRALTENVLSRKK